MDKKPRALILASVASMIDQFNMQNIQLLLDGGYEVAVACNCKVGNTISDERIQNMIKRLADKGVQVIHVPIPRKITNLKEIRQSLVQVKKLCDQNEYDLLHCHSPIGSVVARLAALNARKRHGTKVIYTAHGFHFYRGAPKRNWIIFYPIEKICSRWTDVLITINKEDYDLATTHMKAKKVMYVPGVGIDTRRFFIKDFDVEKKKIELGLQRDDMIVLSVGELNQNKNHEVIIKAIAKLNNPRIHYFIAGKGDKDSYLANLAEQLGVHLHLLGYRTDVIELLNTADVFAFPSFREGLSVALMEAMAAGLPCAVSKIRGNVDLVDAEGGVLCEPKDVDAFCSGIKDLLTDGNNRMGKYNRERMKAYDVHAIMKMVSAIYGVEVKNAGQS